MNAVNRVLAWVPCDAGGEPASEGLEALCAAAGLAGPLGWELGAAVEAADTSAALRTLSARGARKVWRLRSDGESGPAGLAAALAGIDPAPTVFVFADTLLGHEIAAATAALLETDLVRGCTLLRATAGTVRLGCPFAGGAATAELEWTGARPLVVTIADGAFGVPPAGHHGEAEVSEVVAAAEPPRLRRIREIEPAPEAIAVEEAEVLVAGGAGVGGAEGFELLHQLASRLGGAVAASRVAVDRGWAPYARQVGQTGKSVSPRLYLAVGISGASQHIAGIRSAGRVVAINRDARAPIFAVADLAVVGDLWEVLPALLRELDGGRGGSGP